MKMIKAIFLDIDGTLISGKRPSIKKEVIEGLKQVRKKGIQLFIASGRHMLELEELKLVEQFEFDGYLLLNGGYCIIGSQIIYDNKIPQEDLKEIVKIVKENNYPCLFIESNQMYITHVNPVSYTHLDVYKRQYFTRIRKLYNLKICLCH